MVCLIALYFLKLFSDVNLCNVITYHKDFMKCFLFFQKTNADLQTKYLLKILPSVQGKMAEAGWGGEP